MRTLMIAAAAFGLCGLAAPVLAVDEVEPNDSLLTAQDLGTPAPGALAILAELESNDVDFYAITIGANTLLSVSIFDFTPAEDFDNDSYIALFDSLGNELINDDDNGPGFLSQFSLILPDAGTYFIGVTGFGDLDFVGDHDEAFSYKAIVALSPIPAPATLAGLAGLMAVRGRRRK